MDRGGKYIFVVAISIFLLGLVWFILAQGQRHWQQQSEPFATTLSDTLTVEERKFRQSPETTLTDFVNHQTEKRNLFHYGSIPVSGSILDRIQDFGSRFTNALQTSPDDDFARKLVRATDDDTAGKQAVCDAIRSPAELSATRTGATGAAGAAGAAAGCGWWHRKGGPSQALYGTAAGPNERLKWTDANGDTGEWIWDVEEAQKAEDIKVCAAITACGLIDTRSSECAFCTEKGSGIPYNPITGTLKYPTDSSASCASTSIITSSVSCPPKLRGVCSTGKEEDRKPCLDLILTMVGGAKPAGLYRKFLSSKEPQQAEEDLLKQVIDLLVEQSKIKSTELLSISDMKGNESISVSAHSEKVKRVQELAQRSPSKIVRSLATALLYNGALVADLFREQYPVFADGDKMTAAVSAALSVAQQEFRKAGCQASGSAYPTKQADLAGRSLNELRRQYDALYADMTQSDIATVQQDAVRKCLNAGVSLNMGDASGPFCNEPGVEYMVYSGQDQNGGPRTLIGRVLSRVGLLKDPRSDRFTSYQDSKDLSTTLQSAEDSQVSYTARTVWATA